MRSERTTLGKLTEDEATLFVAKFPLAEFGSRDEYGNRRIVTYAVGIDRLLLKEHFDSVVTGRPVRELKSIPVLSPGVKDPMPCVPCQYTHTESWANTKPVINEHRLFLKRFATGQEPFPAAPEPQVEQGVLWVGGGKYWPGVVVGIRLLRELGCTLPIQVWYRGHLEPIDASQVEGLDVQLIDSEAHANEHGGARILGGWEAKLWAISHCGMRRILYLDADAYCVADPTDMLQKLEHEPPFQFWRDAPAMENKVNWERVWPDGLTKRVPQIQGGQLLIDVPRAWRLIMLSHWMCQHSDFYFKHMFGDQDVWRVAATAIAQDGLWRDRGEAPWIAPAFVIPNASGHATIVHRCNGKLFDVSHIPTSNRTQYSVPHWHLPMEQRVFDLLAEVMPMRTASEVFGAIYRKRLWGSKDPSGSGAQYHEAKPWIDLVNQIISERGIRTVVDLGCGSGAVTKHISAREVIGIDVHQVYDGQSIRQLDFFEQRDQIPQAGLLLMKDVLHHWPNDMITAFLAWLNEYRSRWGIILFCFDRHQPADNANCHLGGYRALSPQLLPLSHFEWRVHLEFNHKVVVEFV